MKTLFEAFTQDFDLDVFTKDPNYQTTGKKEVLIKIYPTVNSAITSLLISLTLILIKDLG